MVTSNHIHFLVTDDPNDKRDVIPNSIKLIGGRTGVVENPFEWRYCGLHKIINPKKPYGIIDHEKLMGLLNFSDFKNLRKSICLNYKSI